MIKLPPTQLITAPNENTAQSIAIDNQKIIVLQQYLTEFISNPTDRVLIFCKDGGIPFPGKDIQMPLGGLGVVMDPQHDMLSESRLKKFLNSEEGNMLSTLIVYDGAGKFMRFFSIYVFSCFLVQSLTLTSLKQYNINRGIPQRAYLRMFNTAKHYDGYQL